MNRMVQNILLAVEEGDNVIIEALKELFEYIKTKYFTIEYGEYSNLGFSIGDGNGVSLEMIIVFGTIGMVIACFASSFNKGTLGGFIRTLSRNKCFTKESAKTLEELGYLKNSSVRSSLKRGYLKKFVHCVEDENDTLISRDNKEGTVSFNQAHFYIPEEDHYAVEIRFEGKKIPFVFYILVIIAAIAMAILLIAVLPYVFSALDAFVGKIKPESNILT